MSKIKTAKQYREDARTNIIIGIIIFAVLAAAFYFGFNYLIGIGFFETQTAQ